jgi:hypothetical protein
VNEEAVANWGLLHQIKKDWLICGPHIEIFTMTILIVNKIGLGLLNIAAFGVAMETRQMFYCRWPTKYFILLIPPGISQQPNFIWLPKRSILRRIYVIVNNIIVLGSTRKVFDIRFSVFKEI